MKFKIFDYILIVCIFVTLIYTSSQKAALLFCLFNSMVAITLAFLAGGAYWIFSRKNGWEVVFRTFGVIYLLLFYVSILRFNDWVVAR